MKTPHQIANELATKAAKPYASKNDRINISSTVYENVKEAIEADRAQRSNMERFGTFVYSLMNEVDEWNADVFEDIASYAANVLKRPFSEPEEG